MMDCKEGCVYEFSKAWLKELLLGPYKTMDMIPAQQAPTTIQGYTSPP
jgi:hypothetical protein